MSEDLQIRPVGFAVGRRRATVILGFLEAQEKQILLRVGDNLCSPQTKSLQQHILQVLYSLHSLPFQLPLPFHHRFFKPNQEHSSIRPHLGPGVVCASLRIESHSITDPLNNPRNKSRNTQLVHLLGHRDIMIRHRGIVYDHVLVRTRRRLLQGIRRPGEENRV